MFHELVQFVEINIGEELACYISERQSYTLAFRKARDDNFDQLQQYQNLSTCFSINFNKIVWIDRIEKFSDIALERKNWMLPISTDLSCKLF